MNIQRSFKLHENVSLDFRGELLNVFNHGNVDVNSMAQSGLILPMASSIASHLRPI